MPVVNLDVPDSVAAWNARPAPAQAQAPEWQDITVKDDNGQCRSVFDVAREIVADGDMRGIAAKHSTTLLTRAVIEKLLNMAVAAAPALVAEQREVKS